MNSSNRTPFQAHLRHEKLNYFNEQFLSVLSVCASLFIELFALFQQLHIYNYKFCMTFIKEKFLLISVKHCHRPTSLKREIPQNCNKSTFCRRYDVGVGGPAISISLPGVDNNAGIGPDTERRRQVNQGPGDQCKLLNLV